MAKIFLVCTKSSSVSSLDISHRLKAICQEITPEIITPNPPLILEREKLAIAIANPVKTIQVRERAICLGVMFEQPEDWWKIGVDIPDGNFALYRFNDEVIELAVDDCGSRNIWYYQDEEVFIASSSQRAIIQYLGSFEFNPNVVPWMLSEGAFLFGESWDKRIKPLPPSAKLTFHINNWTTQIEKYPFPVDYSIQEKNQEEYKAEFINAFEESFQTMNFPAKDWVLPLSGGIDSRALLLAIPQPERLSTVTWGDAEKEHAEKSDAFIAKKLGETFGNPNQFLPIRQDLESLETVMDRFIRYTEGMTDGLAGYLDGFDIWKQLFEEGFSGYLRGDRPLCSTPPIDMDTVMKDLKVRPLDFYENGKELAKWFPQQILPAEMQFKEGEESLAVWQDRLIPLHYGPSIYAAMAECKAGFLEMSNPLLNRKIIKTAYPLRDKIGSVYEVYKKWVLDRTPDIPKGVENSNVNLKDILRSEDMVRMMREEFDRKSAENVFPRQLLTLIAEFLKVDGSSIDNVKPRHTSRLKYWIKQLIPQKFTDQRKKKKKYILDPNILGFRAFIVLRMVKRLEEDTRLFHHVTSQMKSQVPD